MRKIHKSLYNSVDPDEHSEEISAKTPSPPARSPEHSLVSVDERPTCHTRSGRAVIRPARFNDYVMDKKKKEKVIHNRNTLKEM